MFKEYVTYLYSRVLWDIDSSRFLFAHWLIYICPSFVKISFHQLKDKCTLFTQLVNS